MRFAALATDYDETLADHGRVVESSEQALERLRRSGRKLLLVTGRDLDDLLQVFPRVDLFHAVVAENGALLYLPDRKQERRLAEPPPAAFALALGRAKVPITTGRVVSTDLTSAMSLLAIAGPPGSPVSGVSLPIDHSTTAGEFL